MTWRALLAGMAFAALCACETDVEIIGACEAETETVVLPAERGERLLSVGMLGQRVLVMTDRPIGPTGTEWPEDGNAVYVRWLDAALRPEGEPVLLGWHTFRFFAAQWVRVGDALEAQVWAEPEPAERVTADERMVHLWRVPPPGAGPTTSTRVELPVPSPEPGFGVIGISGVMHHDIRAMAPAVRLVDETWFVFRSHPRECGRIIDTSRRLFGIGPSGAARPLHWDDQLCTVEEVAIAANPWTVALSDGSFGVLYRPDAARIGSVHWVRFDETGNALGGVMNVGSVSPDTRSNGNQPRAIATEGRVLFSQRVAEVDDCHSYRVMDENGSNARDAPWHPPCARQNIRNEIGATIYCRTNQYHDLLDLDGLAVLAYSDIANPECDTRPDPDRIVVQLMTRDGRRGSEPLILTSESATPSSYLRAASDGSSMVVAWVESDGFHLRRATCDRTGAD